MYDYIIVGSGLYGAIFAHEAMKAGKSCLVVERRSHIGGNIYTKEMEGIQVHQYGAHIFHTSNKEVWDYLDGNGFHLMTTMYTDLVNNYGKSSSIDEFAQKGQLLGAINSKSIWEVWNYNKLDYGDRFCSGLLFWYHNCSMRQVSSRMWDWSLEPTASLYHTANSLEPLHAQFDYLKNTVSVVNDYYREFKDYKVIAQVYDINSKKVFEESAVVNLPSDGVVNDALTIRFPENISQVHFIKLILKDENGKDVSSNFYWRSNDKYEGSKTLTGPAASGFEDLSKLKQAKVKLTYKVREDDISIFGFNTNEELRMFELLLSVSGVGAKTALAMLAVCTPSEFVLAIISEDVNVLTSIPGIGPKSAKRIILELKDKIKKEQQIQELTSASKGNSSDKTQTSIKVKQAIEKDNKVQEAIAALQVLGYNKKEIEKAFAKIDKTELSTEDLIKKGLLILAG